MKKLLEKGTYITLLILVTIASYGQTYQNPTFGTVTTKTAPTTTTDPYVGTINSDGKIGKVAPEEIPLTIIPPTTYYTPVTPNLKGHLQGIDNALGNIPLTTAGNTTRVWFTGDATTITAGTFYLTNATGKGSVANVSQSVTNDDNQKKYFTQDLIGNAFATTTIFPPGVYAGNLSASTTPNSAQQRFTVELYRCDTNGTPIASGIAGAPVGDLGVTVILILDSGLLTLADGSVTNVQVSASLASQLTINVGERIRYHVSAEKVGTVASNITESVWYGSSFNSFLDVPTPITSSGVSNVSTVTGATVTTALDNLNTGKANDANVLHKTGDESKVGILTLDSQLKLANGTISAPSILFFQDPATDTGINHVNDGEIDFVTNGIISNTIKAAGITSLGANLTGETPSTIASFDASKNIKSLNTSTYPSLTELSYVKGVTSSLQSQLNGKIAGLGTTNTVPKFTSASTLGDSRIIDNGTVVSISRNSATTTPMSNTILGLVSNGNNADVTLMFSDATAFSSSIGQANNGSLYFAPSGTTRMTISGISGVVNMQNLSGTGTRTVVATSTGDLKAVPTKITITTSISITTDTTDSNGIGQDSKHVVIDNGVNAINITCNGGVTTSYGKVGTGAITFVQGSGRTLVQLSGTAILNGTAGSTATLWSNGTTDYLAITNY